MKGFNKIITIFTFIYLLTVTIQSLIAQPNTLPKLTLGVLPFSHAGVERYEAVSLSNRLHSGLVGTKQFQVVEIEKVNSVMNELAFQLSGACTDAACAAKAGQQLGAKWMVTGAVGKVGQTYTIDVRVIDVETRQTILTIPRDFRGEIDALLNLMIDIANELAEKTADRLKTGQLEVKSTPAGAEVYLNHKLAGQTPLLLQMVPIGEYRLEIRKAGYLNYERAITIQPLATRRIDELLQRLCRLIIISNPQGAQIFLDDERVGTTPWSKTMPEGTYKLKLKKNDYLTHAQKLSLAADRTLRIELHKDPLLVKRMNDLRNHRKNDRNLKPARSHKWAWILGGTALVGGGIAAWLLLEKERAEEPVEVIGLPPEPPGKP